MRVSSTFKIGYIFIIISLYSSGVYSNCTKILGKWKFCSFYTENNFGCGEKEFIEYAPVWEFNSNNKVLINGNITYDYIINVNCSELTLTDGNGTPKKYDIQFSQNNIVFDIYSFTECNNGKCRMVKWPEGINNNLEFMNCEDPKISSCDIRGTYIWMNAPIYPLNSFDNRVYFPSATFTNWFITNHTAFYEIIDCNKIVIRNESNGKMMEFEILHYTGKFLILKNSEICPNGECVFLKDTDSNFEKLEQLNCLKIDAGKSECDFKTVCTDQSSAGYKCLNKINYVDLEGNNTLVDVIKDKTNKYIFNFLNQTGNQQNNIIVKTGNDFKVVWTYPLKAAIWDGPSDYLSTMVVDNSDNIYIVYLEFNTGLNTKKVLLTKIDPQGNKIFDKTIFQISNVSVNDKDNIKLHNNKLYFYNNSIGLASINLDGSGLKTKILPKNINSHFGIIGNSIIIFSGDSSNPLKANKYDLDLNLVESKILDNPTYNGSKNGEHIIESITESNNELLVGVHSNKKPLNHKFSNNCGFIMNENLEITDIFSGTFNSGLYPVTIKRVNDGFVAYTSDYFVKFDVNKKYQYTYNTTFNSTLYQGLKVERFFEIGDKYLFIGEGKRFLNTAITYEFDKNSIYPYVNCNYTGTTSVVDESKTKSINIFPNPANYLINVELKNYDKETFNYNIINTQGLIIKSGFIENEKINISDLNPGLYFLQVLEMGKWVNSNIKFIKI